MHCFLNPKVLSSHCVVYSASKFLSSPKACYRGHTWDDPEPKQHDHADAQRPHDKGRDRKLEKGRDSWSISWWDYFTFKKLISRIKQIDNNSNQSNLISDRTNPHWARAWYYSHDQYVPILWDVVWRCSFTWSRRIWHMLFGPLLCRRYLVPPIFTLLEATTKKDPPLMVYECFFPSTNGPLSMWLMYFFLSYNIV